MREYSSLPNANVGKPASHKSEADESKLDCGFIEHVAGVAITLSPRCLFVVEPVGAIAPAMQSPAQKALELNRTAQLRGAVRTAGFLQLEHPCSTDA